MEINLSDVLHIEKLIRTAVKNKKESAALMQMSPPIGALHHILMGEADNVPLQTPKQLTSAQVCK